MRMRCSFIVGRYALMAVLFAGLVSSLLIRSPHAQTTDQRWWQRQPIRFLQTNLSETDSTVDPAALVARGRRLRRQHFPDEHGRHRRAVPDPGPVPLCERAPAAWPRSVR